MLILDNFATLALDDTGNIISKNPIEEAKRLANELRNKPARTFFNAAGIKVSIKAYIGFNIEDCDLKEILNYLNNKSIIKSKSIIHFLYRVISVRFPNELVQQKKQVDERFKSEIELIESNSKNDIYWLGETGFQNMVSYTDKSIFSKNINILKKKNDMIAFKKI
tara:strand:+ start:732 stop:1226 length:495 start_codon:yes stop_codon:yes gene_type:complete